VVAAPQTESAIKLAGIEFDGYPGFVAAAPACLRGRFSHDLLRLARTEMRISHATLHASLRQAIDMVTRSRVLNAIRSTDSALRRLGIGSPRIAVSG